MNHFCIGKQKILGILCLDSCKKLKDKGRAKMITDKQRRTLSMILFSTGIICLLFYLPVILYFTHIDYFPDYFFLFSWYGEEFDLLSFSISVLPAFLVFFGCTDPQKLDQKSNEWRSIF